MRLLSFLVAISCFSCIKVLTYDGLTIVIDSGIEQPLDKAYGAVSLITSEEIEQKQFLTMAQLLKSTPGVRLQDSGGGLSQLSLYMRGTNSNQTLVLIDGMRMSNATSGTSALQFLDPEQIARVEIIRGVKTALYGADAIGGVINIITLPNERTNRVSLSGGVGSHETYKASVGLQGVPFEGNFSQFSFSYADSKGYDFTPTQAFSSGDKEGYDNAALLLQSHQSINETVNLKLNYLRNTGKNEYDNIWGYWDPSDGLLKETSPYQHFLIEAYQLSMNLESDYLASKIRLGRLNDVGEDKDTINPTKVKFQTTRDSAYWQNDAYWSQHVSTFALDYYLDKVKGGEYINGSQNSVDERYNWAWLLQQQLTFGAHDIKLAIREDFNESYDQQVTGQIAWQYFISSQTKLAISLGTGFKAPSFNDLYYPGFGNPDLKPEHSQQAEISFSHDFDLISLQWTLFYNQLDDMILLTPIAPSISLPENIGEAKIKGSEWVIKGQWQQFDYQLSYSWLDPKDDTHGRQLASRVKHLLNFDFSHQWKHWHYGIAGNSQDRSFSYGSDGKAYKMAGFTTIDLYTAYQLTEKFTAKVKINNLLDKSYVINQYSDSAGDFSPYLNAGIQFFAQLQYRLDF